MLHVDIQQITTNTLLFKHIHTNGYDTITYIVNTAWIHTFIHCKDIWSGGVNTIFYDIFANLT